MKFRFHSDKWQVTGDTKERVAQPEPSCHSSHDTCHSQRGIALVITLIMLAITLVMAVAFLALAQRERNTVNTTTDSTLARQAAETAAANAQAQIMADFLSSFNGSGSTNAFNLHLFVSTNYINPQGFNAALGYVNPTNVNYDYPNGASVVGNDLEQNVANLWFLPRAPVFIPTNQAVSGYDFRFYLDLNQNGVDDPNGIQPVISGNASLPYYDLNSNLVATFNPPNALTNFMVGDPEWVGVLEHPDAPHSANNHFISRYAFVAVPAGNTMDINFIHNDAYNIYHGINQGMTAGEDGFMRNQGVGSWEINLASFLADLNTNEWDSAISPQRIYNYQTFQSPGGNNTGSAFDDALSLLAYRYDFSYAGYLAPSTYVLNNAANTFPRNGIDDYSQGPLQTTLDYNADSPVSTINASKAWSGSDSTNHYFNVSDFFDSAKLPVAFADRLGQASSNRSTYDRYTFYRMLDQLGSDSAPDDGRLNLNYSNAVVTVSNGVMIGANIIIGAETNQVRWQPTNFFLAAADRMLRYYSSNWYNANPAAFTNTFGITNASFGVGSIPVFVSNRFVYAPSIHRLLQLAANIYDASTNGSFNLPHVFRPVFERIPRGNYYDLFVVNYVEVKQVTGTGDPQLAAPFDVNQLSGVPPNTPILGPTRVPINVYGVPWIVGAKKGLPGFNQLYLTNSVQVTRKLQYTRPKVGAPTSQITSNELYVLSFNPGLGISFWNSYTNGYTNVYGPLVVYAKDALYTSLVASNNSSGQTYSWAGYSVFNLNNNLSSTYTYPNGVWPGTQWVGSQPYATVGNPNNCFLSESWQTNFLSSPTTYQFGNPPTFQPVLSVDNANNFPSPPDMEQLPQLYLSFTNYMQAYILDGNHVIDYVQFRDPNDNADLSYVMMDPTNNSSSGNYYQWSTNAYPTSNRNSYPTYGQFDQFYVSENSTLAPLNGWADPNTFLPSSMLQGTGPLTQNTANANAAEAAYFKAFFTTVSTGEFNYGGQFYYNILTTIQAPYTPSRTLYVPYLMQANDPLVHYLGSDLNGETGAKAVWLSPPATTNGYWDKADNITTSPFPIAPATPIGGQYQPWGVPTRTPVTGGDFSGYNLRSRDPLAWKSDNWDFPTNLYPTPGWLGRVHRGTPWQTVYLKSRDILTNSYPVGSAFANSGSNEWAAWTGDILPDYYSGQYVDASRSSPAQDRMLFDIFTTRFDDNSTRGTLPVNQSGLAAWSALFGGMVVLSNNTPNTSVFSTTPLSYDSWIVNPAGPDMTNSALWQIVNNTNGINAARANTATFPYQAFIHAGDILATPALTEQSPFLNTVSFQTNNGISDEEYEWLPQQMMGLVRATEPRFVLYCFGQTLRPAPNGTVLSGNFTQLVTNYQVVAESALRAVVRIDGANTPTPRAVVESYNVLPPN